MRIYFVHFLVKALASSWNATIFAYYMFPFCMQLKSLEISVIYLVGLAFYFSFYVGALDFHVKYSTIFPNWH